MLTDFNLQALISDNTNIYGAPIFDGATWNESTIFPTQTVVDIAGKMILLPKMGRSAKEYVDKSTGEIKSLSGFRFLKSIEMLLGGKEEYFDANESSYGSRITQIKLLVTACKHLMSIGSKTEYNNYIYYESSIKVEDKECRIRYRQNKQDQENFTLIISEPISNINVSEYLDDTDDDLLNRLLRRREPVIEQPIIEQSIKKTTMRKGK